MMLKLRPVPILVTIIASSAILFGGWFAYHTFAMEDPFLKEISAIEGVMEQTVSLDRQQAAVRVTLAEEASLRKTVQEIKKAAGSSLGERDIVIEAVGAGGTNETLESWWSTALFDVAEAMETKAYSQIPERMRGLAETNPQGSDMQVSAEMDDNYVYITMFDGQYSKYVILPRQSALGVWMNE